MLKEVMQDGSNSGLGSEEEEGQAVDCSVRYGTRRGTAGG
jgi:hypothetical protein